jgi:hypothetical protein
VYLLEEETSNYGTRNTSTTGSTTGVNKDIPLILDNNNAAGVTEEVREITCLYEQRWKHANLVTPVNLYHEKGRLIKHRTGNIR